MDERKGSAEPTVPVAGVARTAEVRDPLVGQILAERYRIEKKVGEGGMGAVYLATHTLLDKQVALKVLHRDLAQKPELAERFVQEAKAASRIRHEHVIDISDFGTTPDGGAFFAMELLVGHDLQTELKDNRRLPWDRTKHIFLQVCAALAAAHAKGIVHRDLKPGNVFLIEFLGDPDFVKLLDFGIAKLTHVDDDRRLTATGVVFGTPQYMAPEQARGDVVDHRVDVYAMGCILYQLIAGDVPFTASNFMAVLALHLTEPIPTIPAAAFTAVGAPAALEPVVMKALAKTRDERYQTIEELANAVRVACGDPPISGKYTRAVSSSKPPPPGAGMTPERWRRVEEVFRLALEKPIADRASFLADECGNDSELREAVAGLLASTAGATEPLRKLVASADALGKGTQPDAVVTPAAATAAPAAVTPRRFPRWGWIAGGVLAAGLAGGIYVATRNGDDSTTVTTPAATTLRRIAIRAQPSSGTADAWLAEALARITRRELRGLTDRKFEIVDQEAGAEVVQLVYRLAPTGVQIDAQLGDRAVASATSRSVSDAIGKLLGPLRGAIDTPNATPAAEPAEQREMTALGTQSLEAYRIYRRQCDEFLSATWVDAQAIAKQLERALSLDPGWAHGWALLAIVQGRVTPAASTTLERARKAVATDRDDGGQRLLEALRKTVGGENPAAFALLDGALREHPDDPLLGWIMSGLSADRMMLDETVAILRRFHELRPDLQFGGDLAHALRLAGRRDEAVAVVQRWADAYPESEQALLERALIAAEDAQPAEAQRMVERMILVHGETSGRLASLCEVLLLAGKPSAAREIAEKLLLGDRTSRARARYRIGIAAVFEGKFALAYESLRSAAEEMTPLGAESELTQVLEALRGLAPVVGQPGDYRLFTQQLGDAQKQFGMYDATSRFELAMLDRSGACPQVETFLSAIPAGPPRETSRRYMLRVAAADRCGSCKDVVRAGLASNEQSAASLVHFGRCAVAEGDLKLARQALEQATRLSVSFVGPQASPYHAILARFELARVLTRLGDKDAARKQYEVLLGFWGAADRPLPEIASARKELAALTSATK